MIRIALDAMIIDLIRDTPGLLELIQAAAVKGALVIISSHILRDQLQATSDPIRRVELLATYDALPKQEVATHGFVLDVSRLGEARLGNGRGAGITLKEAETGGRGGIHDALIATTASWEAEVLVTEDKELAHKVKKSAVKCEVWGLRQFEAFVKAKA